MHISKVTGPVLFDIEQYMDVQCRYENRLRFSFAHEIGHYMLHGYIYETFEIDTPQEYLNFVMNFPENEYKSFEWQANEFAGSLLVHRTRLFSGNRGRQGTSECQGFITPVGQ